MQNLELSNANGLDDSILNTYSSCCGIDAYSNGDGITPEQAKQAAELAQSGIKVLSQIKKSKEENKSEIEKQIKNTCGRKPLLSKKKKKVYKECVDKVYAKNKELTLPNPTPTPPSSSSSEKVIQQDDKFLGMPKTLGITVTVLGGLAILVGGFFLIKKFRNQ